LKKYQEDFAAHLVKSGALRFETVKLMSGRLSPYYVSLRKAVSDGSKASSTAKAYAKKIVDIGFHDVDYIHGPAYAGIPLACLTAMQLWKTTGWNLRWGYNRKEAKLYGMPSEKIIVGDLEDKDRVLIVDDVLTTGETKMSNWQLLCNLGKKLELKGVLVAFDRQETDEEGRSASETLGKEGVNLYSILNLSETLLWLVNRKIKGSAIVDDIVFGKIKEYVAHYGSEIAQKALC
jgi:orotate phosphoribosyltransferase